MIYISTKFFSFPDDSNATDGEKDIIYDLHQMLNYKQLLARVVMFIFLFVFMFVMLNDNVYKHKCNIYNMISRKRRKISSSLPEFVMFMFVFVFYVCNV